MAIQTGTQYIETVSFGVQPMSEKQKEYTPPRINKVLFEDHTLVAFDICQKVGALNDDPTSSTCCQIQQFGGVGPGNMSNYSQS